MSRVDVVRLSDADYLHGDALYYGDRQAMVVRTEESSWTVFIYKHYRQWCLWASRPDTSKEQAMREALHYLKTGKVTQSGPKEPMLCDKSDEIMKKYLSYPPYKTMSLSGL